MARDCTLYLKPYPQVSCKRCLLCPDETEMPYTLLLVWLHLIIYTLLQELSYLVKLDTCCFACGPTCPITRVFVFVGSTETDSLWYKQSGSAFDNLKHAEKTRATYSTYLPTYPNGSQTYNRWDLNPVTVVPRDSFIYSQYGVYILYTNNILTSSPIAPNAVHIYSYILTLVRWHQYLAWLSNKNRLLLGYKSKGIRNLYLHIGSE